jgi:hypothetical protein
MFKRPAILTSLAIKKVTDTEGAVLVCTIQSCDLQIVVIGIIEGQSCAMIRNYLAQHCAHAVKKFFACRPGERKLIGLYQRLASIWNIPLRFQCNENLLAAT